MINIIVPMAGLGSRFYNEGYDMPKPFIKVNELMMIEHVLRGLYYPDAHYTLIIQEKLSQEYPEILDNLRKHYPVAFSTVRTLTQGAACTALSVHEIINNNLPVIFADCDNIFENAQFQNFVTDCLQKKSDGSLLTFPSQEKIFSYAKVDNEGILIETKEKEPVSSHAICGAYMFAKGSDFVKAAIDMMIYGQKEKNEFYMSQVYNAAVKFGLKFKIYEISAQDWHCVGTPKQLDDFLKHRE